LAQPSTELVDGERTFAWAKGGHFEL